MNDLATRITLEIEARLKSNISQIDYFICLMAQNDAQSRERIAALESELTALRAANAEMRRPSEGLPIWNTKMVSSFGRERLPAPL